MTITAAADGSALGNPGPAGWAWYVDEGCWAAGGWPHGTNNQGELMAVLDLFLSTAHRPEEDLRILCDSQYVINSVTKWMPGWKRKGWRKGDGKPVLNLELLQRIDAALVGRRYSFEWVRGHAGHELNEAADLRARAAAIAYQSGGANIPAGPGFPGAAEGAGHEVEPEGVAVNGAVPARAHTPAGRAAVTMTADRDVDMEPDLFSELVDEGFTAATANDEELVVAQERELLDPGVRADIGRLGVLLHPDFYEIGQSGRTWTRDTMMAALETDPGAGLNMDEIAVARISADTILLTYHTDGTARSALRSSLWLRDGAQWRLRFHQGTPVA